jgi:hypothetical protein
VLSAPPAAPPAPAPTDAPRPSTLPPPPARRLINLAALSDGAAVVAANPEAKRPERCIDGDPDSFMKNDCAAAKWLVIELSQVGERPARPGPSPARTARHPGSISALTAAAAGTGL